MAQIAATERLIADRMTEKTKIMTYEKSAIPIARPIEVSAARRNSTMTAITGQTKSTSATITPRIRIEARMPSRPGGCAKPVVRRISLMDERVSRAGVRGGRTLANLLDSAIDTGGSWIARAGHVAE
jgi:hypothetical protein